MRGGTIFSRKDPGSLGHIRSRNGAAAIGVPGRHGDAVGPEVHACRSGQVSSGIRPMKVLHVCSFYRPLGGAEKLLFSVLNLLESNGVENVIVAPKAQSSGPTGQRKEYFLDF